MSTIRVLCHNFNLNPNGLTRYRSSIRILSSYASYVLVSSVHTFVLTVFTASFTVYHRGATNTNLLRLRYFTGGVVALACVVDDRLIDGLIELIDRVLRRWAFRAAVHCSSGLRQCPLI